MLNQEPELVVISIFRKDGTVEEFELYDITSFSIDMEVRPLYPRMMLDSPMEATFYLSSTGGIQRKKEVLE
jgi:hypothetical protein